MVGESALDKLGVNRCEKGDTRWTTWYTFRMSRKVSPARRRDQQTVVLEGIRDTVKLIHEAVQPIPKMKEKLDATFDEVGNLRVEMDAVKAALKILGRDVESLKQDMGVVKSDLRVIKNDLKAKVDREEFETLEERVERLEEVTRAR